MQTVLPFVKVIWEFFVLKPKLAFEPQRKNYRIAYQIIVKESRGHYVDVRERFRRCGFLVMNLVFTFCKHLLHFLQRRIGKSYTHSAFRQSDWASKGPVVCLALKRSSLQSHERREFQI